MPWSKFVLLKMTPKWLWNWLCYGLSLLALLMTALVHHKEYWTIISCLCHPSLPTWFWNFLTFYGLIHDPTLVLWYSYVGWSLLFVFNTFTNSQYLCAMIVLSIQEIASRIWPSCSHSESRSMLQLRSSRRGDQQEDPSEGCPIVPQQASCWV